MENRSNATAKRLKPSRLNLTSRGFWELPNSLRVKQVYSSPHARTHPLEAALLISINIYTHQHFPHIFCETFFCFLLKKGEFLLGLCYKYWLWWISLVRYLTPSIFMIVNFYSPGSCGLTWPDFWSMVYITQRKYLLLFNECVISDFKINLVNLVNISFKLFKFQQWGEVLRKCLSTTTLVLIYIECIGSTGK